MQLLCFASLPICSSVLPKQFPLNTGVISSMAGFSPWMLVGESAGREKPSLDPSAVSAELAGCAERGGSAKGEAIRSTRKVFANSQAARLPV